MAIVAGQGPEDMKLTVRNTFLNVLDDEEDPLFRTSSDPLGGQCEMQARHIAKAKQQAMSSKLFTHDESYETTEDSALCRSMTWDPFLQGDSASHPTTSQDGHTTDDVSESPIVCPQVGATAPGIMPTKMPVVRSPAPLSTQPQPFAGGSAFFNSMPSELSSSTAMTAHAQPFVPSSEWSKFQDFNSSSPSFLSGLEDDHYFGARQDDRGGKDMRRKGYGKGSKGKGKQIRPYALSPEGSFSTAEVGSIVLETSRRTITSKGPQFSFHHRFHPETAKMGLVSPDQRTFTKEQYMGRLSVITEDRVHREGSVNRYAVQFCSGELSNADGVGFIFSNKLPCPKNIQKIVSIFANKTGRICMRAHAEVLRSETSAVKPLELGDWIELEMDLQNRLATFTVWPVDGSMPSSATLNFGNTFQSIRSLVPSIPDTQDCVSGYMAVVVKHTDVTVTIGS
eukprot:symbB.v1.2.009222.t1/scaffold582.1/size184522/8